MPYLPPELLALVISLAVPSSPCEDHKEWIERQRTLSRCSLVHSSWTSFAQELLFAEHRLDSEDPNLEKKVAQGRAASEGSFKTKYLTICTDFFHIISTAPCELWKNVMHVTLSEIELSASELCDHARFPQLETLTLNDVDLILPRHDGSLCSFSHLRRLVLRSTALSGDISIYQAIFSPSCMPLLSHLSLDMIDYPPFDLSGAFVLLTPQLTSLAISDEGASHMGTLVPRGFGPLSRLVHLSINQERTDHELLRQTLENAGPLQLDSLHLRASILSQHGVLPLLIEIAKGQRKNTRIARIVLYGSPRSESKEDVEKEVDLSELGDLEWRANRALPFADFDGR